MSSCVMRIIKTGDSDFRAMVYKTIGEQVRTPDKPLDAWDIYFLSTDAETLQYLNEKESIEGIYEVEALHGKTSER
jgi:hypothetical protein